MELLNEKQQTEIQSRLLKAYAEKKSNNSAYSLRAFSLKMGISSGAMSEILQSKRRLTYKTAQKILRNLNVSPNEIAEFIENKDRLKEPKERPYQDLSMDQYEVLSNWLYLSLLNLLELPQVEHSPKNLAERLGLSVKKIESALARLMRLEMIEEKDGRYVRTFIRYQTSEDISNAAIKKYHHETLELSEKALRETEVALRDFSSIVLKINPKNLKNLKSMIRKFQDEVAEMVENDEPDEVYHLNVHLYPITKKKE